MFVYLAALFGQMPGGTWFFAPLFFLVLVLAGLSSLIAMMELAVRNIMDFGLARKPAVVGVAVVTFIAGVPSAVSLDVFANQDNVWGIGLLLSGLLAAVAMMRYGLERARAELDADSDFPVGAWWKVLIGLFPVMSLILFGWFIYGSLTDPEQTWWNPFEPYSVATMVIQWAILLAVMLLLNNVFARKITGGPMTPSIQER
jgi:NSS family neurotransmitter:Na+ symporter